MNRYKSVSTCAAPGVAAALPAPVGHLWEREISSLTAACHPPFLSCGVPPRVGLIILLNLYLQPQEASRD